MEKSKSSLLSSSIYCVRQMVLRVGFKFKLTIARVRTPAPSRLLLALLAGYGVQALALPTGSQVTSGGVTVAAPANNTLNITQTTNKGAINWQSFNVGAGETVNFLQPSATSSTLNRVVGSDPTSIFGQINANGQIFLINNSGIYFAPGSQVNAAGLVASTLSLTDSDYLAGNYTFSGSTGSVDNRGVLKAGFVALAGAQVSNTGSILADGGTAALAAGGRVTLNVTGNDLVAMSVDAPTAAALVRSGGIVRADGGQVLISAKAADALLNTVINVDGLVQAHSVGTRNGVITLNGGDSGVVNIGGTLDASGKGAGETGGTVKVTGANVGLFGGGIDASGSAGGGIVRVGGDWHGAGADGDANASQAIVDGNSVINANAVTSGNGGNVVLWSNDRTQFAGTITATGGALGGRGGDVETSSHVLQVSGKVDVSGAKGDGGSWLLDPDDITISNGLTTLGSQQLDLVTFNSVDYNSNVNAISLGLALSNGAVVNVNTLNAGTGNPASGTNGDIFVNANVNAALAAGQSATLNLNAQRNISFTNADLGAGAGSLNVNVNAGTPIGNIGTPGQTPGVNASTFSMDATSSINTGTAGNLAITTKGTVGLGDITVGGTLQVVSNDGAISQTSNALNVTGASTFNAGAAAITLDATGNVLGSTVGLANSGANNVTVVDSGNLTLGAITLGTGTNTITAGPAVGTTLSRGNTPTLGAPLVLNVGGQAVDTGVAAYFAGGNGSGVTITAASATTQDVTIAGASTLSAMNVSGNLDVTAAANITQTGAIAVGGTTDVHGLANAIDLSTPTNNFTGAFSVSNTAGDVTVATVGNLVLGTVSVGPGVNTFSAGTPVGSTLSRTTAPTIDTAGGGTLALNVGGNAVDGSVVGFFQNGAATSVAVAAAAGNKQNLTAAGVGALPALNVSGNLDLTATSAVSQTGAFNVGGTTNVTGNANAIDLSNTANLFTGTVSVSNSGPNNVSITSSGNLALGTLNLGSGVDTFTAGTAVGSVLSRTTTPVVQGGSFVLSVGGATPDATLAAFFANGAATGVSLTATAAGQDVAITGASALSALNVTGNLDVTAGADLTQTGAITVTGTTNVHGFAHAIDLSTTTNDFTGAVSLSNSAGNVSLTSSGNLVLGTVNIAGGTNTIVAGAVTGTGSTLTRGGALTVGAPLALNVGGQAVDTGVAGYFANGVATGVTITATTGTTQDVAITGAGVLSAMNVSGNLGVTAGTDISQTGALSVAGTTNVSGGQHAIDLSNTGNVFTGLVGLSNSGVHNVSIADGGNLTLGAVSVGAGTNTFTAGTAVGSTLARTTPLAVEAGGTVAVNVGGAAADPTLASFFGTGAATGVSIVAAAGNKQDVAATGVGALPALTVSGNLDLTATSNVSQSGALNVGGTTNVTGNANVVDLSNTGNVFTGTVSVSNQGPNNVSVTSSGNLALGTINVGSGVDTFTAGTAVGSVLSRTTTPTLQAGGSVVLNVGGAAPDATVAAFFGSGAATGVSVTAAAGAKQDVAITGASVLTALDVSGNLAVTAGADITQTGALTVGGTTNVNGLAHAIGLSTTTNAFTGAVSLANTSGDVSLTSGGNLTLGTVNIAGGTNTIVAGAVTGTGSTLSRGNALVVGAPLSLTVGGQAVDSGVASYFTNGAATGVTIAAATNTTQDVTVTGAGVLTSMDVSGNLNVTGTSDVSQSAGSTLIVDGTTTVNAIGHGIDLSHTTNAFVGTVIVNNSTGGNSGGNNVAIGFSAADALNLGTSHVGTGTFTVNGANDILQGANTITQDAGAGAASFTTTAHVINLGSTGNVFTGLVNLANSGPNNVTVATSGNLALGTVAIGSGTNSFTAGTAVGSTLSRTAPLTEEAGATTLLTVGGNTLDPSVGSYFASGSAASVTVTAAAANKQNLSATGASVLPTLAVSGNLDIAAVADVSQVAASTLTIGGTTTVDAIGHAIDLSHATNTFGGTVVVNNSTGGNSGGNNVAIGFSGTNALTLGTSHVGTGTFTVNGSNDILQGANSITQDAGAGAASFTTTGHVINLGSTGNVFTGAVSLANTGPNNVTLTNSGNLTLGSVHIGSGTNTITAGSAQGTTLTRTTPLVVGSTPTYIVGGTTVDAGLASYFTTGAASSVTITADALNTLDLAIAGATVLDGFTVSGNLDITAAGDISQSGATVLSVGGTTTIHGGANAVDISHTGNTFGGDVSVTNQGAHNVAIGATGALHLGTSSVGSGTFTVNATGAITEGSHTITQQAGAGAASFTTGGAAITLTGNNDFTGAVSLNNTGANNVAVTDVNAIQLGASTVGSGTFAVTAGGDITQSAALHIGGASTFAAGIHNVVLDNTANTFAGAVAAGGTSVTIDATGNLDATGTTLAGGTGNLTLLATGTLTPTGAVTTTGNIALTSGGGLTTTGALQGANVTLTGTSVTVHDNVTSSGLLTLASTAGAITQSAGTTVAANGTGTFTATGGAVTLNGPGNVLTNVTASGSSIGLTGTGPVTAHLTTAGTAAVTGTGVTTVDGSAGTGLTVTGNGIVFGATSGATTTVGTGALTVNDNGTGTPVTQNGAVLAGPATNTVLNVGANTVTLANDANQFGAVTVNGSAGGGSVTLHDGASGMAVTLGNAANTTLVSTGAVSVASGNTGAGMLAITGGSVSFGALTLAGNLAATTTAGAITQTGAVSVAGTSTLNAGSNAITLNSANALTGDVTLTGGTVSLNDASALKAHLNGTGNTTLGSNGVLTVDGSTANGGNLTLNGASVVFGDATTPAATTVAGALSATTTTGGISQNAVLHVNGAGASTLNANGHSLVLTQAANTFGGPVTASGSTIAIVAAGDLNVAPTITGGAGDLTLTSGGTLTLPASAISTSGNVTLTSANGLTTSGDIHGGEVTLAGGAITIGSHIDSTDAFSATSGSTIAETGSGFVTVGGNSTLNAGANAITLNSTSNNFNTVSVTGGAVSLADTNNVTVHLLASTSANLTAGNGGVLTVDGQTTAGNLTATGGGVTFGGAGTAVTGNLIATANAGTITQAGAGSQVTVTGTSGLSSTGGVTLTNGANDFGGLVTAGGAAVALTDANALSVHLNAAAGGTLTATNGLTVDGSTSDAGGTLTLAGTSIQFGANGTTLAGGLAATTAGTITQAGTLSVGGASALNAGASAITLTNPANSFAGAVTLNTTGAVGVADTGPLAVHLVNTGTANLGSTGQLTVDGGASSLVANGLGVAFGPGATHVTGALAVNSGSGAITQTGTLTADTTTALTSNGGAITLANAGNDFGGLVTVADTGGAVSLRDANALSVHLAGAGSALLVAGTQLMVDGTTSGLLNAQGTDIQFGPGSTSVGSLQATASTGSITQTSGGDITAPTASLTAGTAIILTNPGNHFGDLTVSAPTVNVANSGATVLHLTGGLDTTFVASGELDVDGNTSGAVALTGNGTSSGKAIVFGTTNITNTLNAQTNGTGSITQTAGGTLSVSGASTFNAGASAVTLANAGNHLQGLVTVTGGTVQLSSDNALAVNLLNTGNVIGDATLTANGAALSVSGSNGGALTANGLGVLFATGGTTVGGALTVHSNGGDITQSGALSVGTTSDLEAGAGNVALTNANNHFGQLVTANANTASVTAGDALKIGGTTASDMTLVAGGIDFGTANVGGALRATTTGNGAITQSGVLTVTGASTLTTTGNAAVTLANTGNDFQAPVTVTAGAVSLADKNALNVHLAAATAATLNSVGVLTTDGGTAGGLTATSTGAGIVFGPGATTVGGVLTANAANTITQTGALHVNGAGANSLTAVNGVTLTNDVHFAGPVTLAGGAVTLADTGALTAHLNTVSGAVLTAGGALSVDGTATNALTANGTSVAFGAAGTHAGSLNATATSGDITQAGTVVITGTSGLTATAGNIALANAGNDFGGLVTAAAANDIKLSDANALSTHIGNATTAELAAGGLLTVDGSVAQNLQATGVGITFGAANTQAGSLTAQGGTGAITQAGTLAVTGTSSLTGASITLDNTQNDFGGATTLTSAGTVKVSDKNALAAHLTGTGATTLVAVGALTVDATSATGLNASGAGVAFGSGATNIGAGGLVVASSGAVTQSAALKVTGTSTLNAGANAITLTNAGNDFTGAVTATGGAVQLTDANSLIAHVTGTSATLAAGSGSSDVLTVDGSTSAGPLTVSGSSILFGTAGTVVHGALAATSGSGTIAQAGTLAVTGASTLTAGANSITLNNVGNDFTGDVTATTSGGAVSLADANALTAHLTAASGTLLAGGALSIDGSTSGNLTTTGAGTVFGPASTTVGGKLAVLSTGAVTQSGDLSVTGTTAISATGQAVTLNRTGNKLGDVTVAGGVVDLEQAAAFTAHVTDSGKTTLVSGAALGLDGTTTGDVVAKGASVAFGANGTTVGGALTATSTAGDITQAGALGVAGASTLAAGSGSIALGTAANKLAGAVTATGANVTIADSQALTAHVTATGNAALTSTATLAVDGSAAAMDLTGGTVNFAAAGTTVNGALTVASGGITQAGALTVTGTSKLAAGAGDIALDTTGVNLQGAITASGNNVRITDTHAIDSTLTTTGDTVLSSTADVKAAGSVGGGLKVTGGTVEINQGTSGSPTTVGKLLDVTSAGDASLGYVTTGSASVVAGNGVLLGGTLKSTTGTVSLQGKTILGQNKLGALDVAAGQSVTLDTAVTGGGKIGQGGTTPSLIVDDNAIIALLGATGKSGINISFNPGQTAFFRVGSQSQTRSIIPHELASLQGDTYFCDAQTCVNVLGQTTAIADSVVSNILNAASQDAADAAFGTENLDFAIRKGYVTTIGRVPPGIDEIAGDFETASGEPRITSRTRIDNPTAAKVPDAKSGAKDKASEPAASTKP